MGGALSVRWAGCRGLTLAELLVAVVVIGIVVMGLHRGLEGALSTYQDQERQREALARARFALQRVVRFAAAADEIAAPAVGQTASQLRVSERLLDTYDNADHGFAADGDGLLDADNDADGLVNEDPGGADPAEYVTFRLDTGDPANGRLMERRPDYATADTADTAAETAIAEQVAAFAVSRPAAGLLEIRLTLDGGASLFTRVAPGRLEGP